MTYKIGDLILRPVLGTGGNYSAVDSHGATYMINGGGLFWGARYAKEGVFDLSVGGHLAGNSPEDALMVLKNCRETFVKYLFDVGEISLETREDVLHLAVKDVPPLRALTSNITHMGDVEAAYRTLIQENILGEYTPEIELFWFDFMDRASESL